MRICSKCKSGLDHYDGYEVDPMDRGGNRLEVDYFRCKGCGVRYMHRYDERFDGDIETWLEAPGGDDTWEVLPRAGWPTSGSPSPGSSVPPPATLPDPAAAGPVEEEPVAPYVAKPGYAPSVKPIPLPPLQAKPTPLPPPDLEKGKILLCNFNSGPVMEYDRDAGTISGWIQKAKLPRGTRYWRGFYTDDRQHLGVYASTRGPMLFVEDVRFQPDRKKTKVFLDDEGEDKRFRLKHRGKLMYETVYEPFVPSMFDWPDASVADFFLWLSENVNDPKWYAFNTVADAESAMWWPNEHGAAPGPGNEIEQQEPPPGPYFGEYVFVFDRERKIFLEQYRVLDPGHLAVNLPDRADWTGSVPRQDLKALEERFRELHPPPRHLTLTMHGDDCASAMVAFLKIFSPESLG